MAIKRVSESYANGIQAFASARRPRPTRSQRPTTPIASLSATAADAALAEAAAALDINEANERAIANIAAEITKAQLAPNERLAAVDYHDIISSTIAGLDHSTKEARHAVYECARQVVYQRLARIRPALPADALERERLSLDQAIEMIEAKMQSAQTAAGEEKAAAGAAAAAIAPVVLGEPRRALPYAKHFHGGAVRLFGMATALCVVLFGYWLATGKPELRSAVTYLHKLPGLPEEAGHNAAPGATAAVSPAAAETHDSPSDAPHGRAASGRAETLAPAPVGDRPQINQYAACGSNSCAEPPGSPWLPINTNTVPPRPAAQPPSARTARDSPVVASRDAPAVASRGSPSSNAINAYERGMALVKDGDPDRAIRDFTDAIRSDPKFSDAYLQRGNMRFKNGNADVAIVDFTDAIAVGPRNAAAFKARAMALLYVGKEDRALEDLTKAIQIAEADPSRLSALELFFARRSRAGIFARKQAGDRELFDLSAMIDAYWKNPDLAEALKADYGIQGASTLMATIYRQRANLYMQRANNEGAIADLSHAIQLDPTRTLALVLERARVQEAAGKSDQALADFQRVLELNPKLDEAKKAVARLKPPGKTTDGSPAYGFESSPFFR